MSREEKCGGVCPVSTFVGDEIEPDTRHSSIDGAVLDGVHVCEKCRALFVPED